MKLILVTIVYLMLVGCQNQTIEKPNLEGDLYFKSFKFGNFYGQPDILYQNYIELRDSLGIEELKKQDSVYFTRFEILEKNGLLKSPYIFLKKGNDSILIVYMSSTDYKHITKFDYQYLIKNKKKVRLKLITQKLTHKLHLCKKLLLIKELEGNTFGKQTKFKIEEYR